MKLSAILAPLIAAKVPHEVILETVRAYEAEQTDALEKRRSSDRERQARKRASHVMSRDITVTGSSRNAGDARGRDNLQTKIPTGQEERKKDAPVARCFPDFWTLYPNKVGKRDAEKAFGKALKRAPPETIMAGLRRYVAKTDDRPWCNPATWLNQDRWEDQPATVTPNGHSPPGRRENAFDAYAEIAQLKGWTDEPSSIPGSDENGERLPAERGEHQGPVVDLRRGAGGSFR